MTPVAVTGMGIVSAAGRGLDATTAALREDRDGLSALTRFESPRCGHFPVAEVAAVSVRQDADAPRTLDLARAALADALAHAGLEGQSRAAAGLAAGTCVAGMPETEAAVARLRMGRTIDEGVFCRHECGFTSDALARAAGLGGPVTTLSTACSSAAQAIGTAADWIGLGVTGAVVAGGSDALSRLTLNGFVSLLNVSPGGCRPFDADRDGMSLGEGAAFLVLESAEHAAARGAEVVAWLCGHAHTCDAHHATAPHPDGDGALAAMTAALREAGLAPDDIDYVNAHGTATKENDRAEGRALRRLFGDGQPWISSTKRVFGHTLGAAGAIEAVVSILAMRDRFVPGTAGLQTVDPGCEVRPLAATRDGAPRTVLSNSFAFGGNNSTLCFRSPEAVRG